MYNIKYCHGKIKTTNVITSKKGIKMSVLKLMYELVPSSDERVTEFDDLLAQ